MSLFNTSVKYIQLNSTLTFLNKGTSIDSKPEGIYEVTFFSCLPMASESFQVRDVSIVRKLKLKSLGWVQFCYECAAGVLINICHFKTIKA